jgi:predicted glycogen debranching enzyme
MLLEKNRAELQNFSEAVNHEWLETNGLGGWAGSSLVGCNTRRYHGLLVAAIQPPAVRMVLVSKLDETIIIDGKKYELGANDYGGLISPTGYQYLSSFKRNIFPEWLYVVNGIQMKKTICMVYDENTTLIRYDILKAETGFTMEMLPLIAARGYHSLQNSNANIFRDAEFVNGIFHNQPFQGAPPIYIAVPGAKYKHDPKWFYNFNYQEERCRGLDFQEDLFNHGIFSLDLKEGDSFGIMISSESPTGKDVGQLFEKEKIRKKSLTPELERGIIPELTVAADQFIVKRNFAPNPSPSEGSRVEELKTVIAGYHWFTDWGRDTMISLPGLCLATGRYEDARKIIKAFSGMVSMGMLPTRLLDYSEAPQYNNADGTLWYFISIYKYLLATGDNAFVLGEILPILSEIVDWHFKGTRYNIHVEKDGLLYAGEKGQQLTWMDARIGDWVVTPRMGKPVEIQALWYNVLKIYASLLEMNGQPTETALANANAEKAKKSFGDIFWYAEGNYLYDVIDENNTPDASLRPNQLFAISLPFTLLDPEKANAVLKIIKQKLYTPVGLRSLSPDDPGYINTYEGDAFKRDGSYHQGTVWSWLLGAYVEGWMKAEGKEYWEQAKKIIDSFSYHLNEACIGSVSEIFDAEAPHHPRGCVAQAWGVAEILRVMMTYELY